MAAKLNSMLPVLLATSALFVLAVALDAPNRSWKNAIHDAAVIESLYHGQFLPSEATLFDNVQSARRKKSPRLVLIFSTGDRSKYVSNAQVLRMSARCEQVHGN
jgi:hypothetical protein